MSRLEDIDAEAAAERAVLGDDLQQRGDPQGELIGLQIALARLLDDAPVVRRNAIERRIATVLDHHHDMLYGPLAPYVMRLSRPDRFDPAFAVTSWRAGFADTVWLQTTHTAIGLVEAYRLMCTLPITRFVRRIVIGQGDHPAMLAALNADPPATLRSLEIGDRSRAIPALPHTNLVATNVVEPLVAQLDELRFAYYVTFVPFDSPTLRTLDVTINYTDRQTFDGANLPALEDLTLWNFRIDVGLLDRYPAVRRVNLASYLIDAGWLEHFLRSSQVERARNVTLQWGLQDADLGVLAARADRVAHLETLDLRTNPFSAAALATARPRLPANVRLPPR